MTFISMSPSLELAENCCCLVLFGLELSLDSMIRLRGRVRLKKQTASGCELAGHRKNEVTSASGIFKF